MDIKERIEQAIISAGAYTGEDTELLLDKVDKLFLANECLIDVIDSIKYGKERFKADELILQRVINVINKHGERLND